MSKEKIFNFDNIDLFIDEHDNLVFLTENGGVCVFDPLEDIFVYDDMDEFNRIFVDCFLEENHDIISNWERALRTKEFVFKDTR